MILKDPYNPNSKVQSFAYTCYAMHTQAIEDVINELAREPNPNDIYRQREICAAYGIDLDALTTQEIAYMESEVAKRWQR